MPIPVKCKCGKQISAPDKLAGKRAKCPACDEVLAIPSAGGSAEKPKVAGTAIPVKCECGKSFAAPAKLAGKAVKCPGCQKVIKVPGGVGQGSPKTASTVQATCTGCGKSFNAPAKLAGKKVGCPSCKQPVQIPGGKLASAAATPALDASGGVDDEVSVGSLLDEVGFQRAAAQNRCPECKEDLGPDAILCVHCGYHLETGKKLETKTVKKKVKKKSSSMFGGKKSSGDGASQPAKEVEVGLAAHALCGWPLILVVLGGLIGGGMGGLAYGINLSIYKTTIPMPVKVILILAIGIGAIFAWQILGLMILKLLFKSAVEAG